MSLFCEKGIVLNCRATLVTVPKLSLGLIALRSTLREFFNPKILISLILCVSGSAFSDTKSSTLGIAEFDKILKEHDENAESRSSHVTYDIKSRPLDNKLYFNPEPVSNTAYGERASVIVDADIREINTYYLRKDAYLNLKTSTFKIVNVGEPKFTIDSIDVPADLVIDSPDGAFNVHDHIIFEKFEKYSRMKWYQDDDSCKLLWNRGYLIIEPHGPGRVVATVYAYHVFKKPIGGFKDFFAGSFTEKHYVNFIRSLQDVVSNKFVYQSK
jgi:hypothetical protein